MKKIHLANYNSNMGILIDVRHYDDYKKDPIPNSINIYVDKLLMDYKKYLDKNKTYYIFCNKGHLSKKAASTLEYFGYNVVQVIR